MSYSIGRLEATPELSATRSPYGLREHLTTVFRQKRTLLTIVGVTVMVAGPGSFLMTSVYKAEVRLLIQSSRTPFSMSTPLTGQVFTPTEISQKDEVATEVQIFTSQVLLDKLVDQFGAERVLSGMQGRWGWLFDFPNRFGRSPKPEEMHYQAVQELRASLNVEGVRQTHVFIATLESPHPDFAAEALNALVDIYLDHHLAVRKGKGSREFFDEQISQIRGDLRDAELSLQTFKDKWNIVSIEDQKRSSLQQLTQIEAALREETVFHRRLELSTRLKTYREVLNTLDQREVELHGLMREVKVKQEALDLYLKKEEDSRINEMLDRKGVSNVRPIEYATVPQRSIQPRKFLNLLIGLFVGLLGGVGSAYVSEYMRRSFVTREEVQDSLRREVIASLPLVRPHSSDARICDVELRQAAQRIMKSCLEPGLRSVLVTSAFPGEGRSYVAGALARALSEQKLHVLLITFEEARPGTFIEANGSNTMMTEGQAARHAAQDIPEPTDRQRLHRLRVHGRGATAMESAEHLTEVAKTMRDRFDLIVIDGPPLTSFPEMRIAVAGIDGTLLVIEAERTVAVAAARAVAAIEAAGGYLLGLILNKRRYIIPEWIYERWLAVGGRGRGVGENGAVPTPTSRQQNRPSHTSALPSKDR
jgi:uncharacterized protein involved in exopolysaccharide biosynthesis/Mrp family chromosome partitioning ATPase